MDHANPSTRLAPDASPGRARPAARAADPARTACLLGERRHLEASEGASLQSIGAE
jgi:hypothetical protein